MERGNTVEGVWNCKWKFWGLEWDDWLIVQFFAQIFPIFSLLSSRVFFPFYFWSCDRADRILADAVKANGVYHCGREGKIMPLTAGRTMKINNCFHEDKLPHPLFSEGGNVRPRNTQRCFKTSSWDGSWSPPSCGRSCVFVWVDKLREKSSQKWKLLNHLFTLMSC